MYCLTACGSAPLVTDTPPSPTTQLGLPSTEPPPSPTRTLTPTDTATRTPQGPTATSFVFPPTVTARPSACEEAPRPTRLVVRERGRVSEENERDTAELVNIREGPGTGNRIIGQMDLGEVFLVLEGPECSSQYAWYQVQFGDTVGWIAEGDREAYYVEPFLVP